MNILIVGYGNIGKHVYKELESLEPDIYDINLIKSNRKNNWIYDAAFICVPTNGLKDGSCDTSIVEHAVKETNARLIIIKSTVPPTTTDRLIKETGKNIIFSPEYYGVTQHCKEDPGFAVFGGEKELCKKAAQIYSRVINGYYKFYFTDTVIAELAKYMLNSFLALKVTFCNEFADVAKKYNVSYPELRELFIADSRISPSHTFVYEDKPYYDSHCFNKDIPALIKFAEGCVPLMVGVEKINLTRKGETNM